MASKPVVVRILGDSKNFTKSLDTASSKLGGFGKKVGKIGLGVGAAVGAMGVVAGGALLSLGNQFDKAYDQIRVGTGATGDSLEALKGDFKAVLKDVPTDFAGASTAVADLNTRLGLTGKPLQDSAKQFINLSRITGTDVAGNVDKMTRAFGDWGVATEDQAEVMDKMFRASQASGIGIGELQTSIVQFGAPMRNLGFTMDDSMALLAQFNKTGVNTETVFAGLKAGVGKLAKEGEDIPTTFRRVVDEITALGPGSEATGKAIELFGQRAGPDLADAIAGGKFELDGMLDAITNGEDTINGAAKDTESFGQKWQMIKNKVFVALEPLAMKLFDGLSNAMDSIMPVVDRLTEAFSEDGFSGVIRELGTIFDEAWPKIQSALGNLMVKVGTWLQTQGPIIANKLLAWGQALVAWIGPQIPPLLRALADFVGKAANWIIEDGVDLLVEKLIEWGNAFVEWVGPQIPPLLAELALLLAAIGEWIITKAAPKLIAKAAQLAAAMIGWAIGLAPHIIGGLAGALLEVAKKVPGWAADVGKWGLSMGGELVAKLIETFLTIPQKVIDNLGNVGSKLFAAGETLGKAFANGLIGIWNRADLTFPRIEVPGWVPGIGGKGFGGFDIFPDLPTFRAMGGPASGLVRVGERGPELVALPRGSSVQPSHAASTEGGVNVFVTNPAPKPHDIGREVAWAIRTSGR